MKKHQTLYIAGAVLLLLGGYMYMKKNSANKTNVAPPMEEGSTFQDTTTPTPPTSGSTLGGASQVIDSIKGLIAEIKTKSTNAVKTITPIV